MVVSAAVFAIDLVLKTMAQQSYRGAGGFINIFARTEVFPREWAEFLPHKRWLPLQ